MSALLRFKTYRLVFLFYRPLLLLSSIITIFLLIAKASFTSVVLFKLLLFFLVLVMFWENKLKKRLIFYQNFGISKTHLFTISFIFDVVIAFFIHLIFLGWF